MRFRSFTALLYLSEAAQQRGNRQALRKHGEGYDGKGNHNNDVTPSVMMIVHDEEYERKLQLYSLRITRNVPVEAV
jgi:hypothetical protein